MTLGALPLAVLLVAHWSARLARAQPRFESVEQLGRAFFFEPLLSFNRQMSCATCHQPERLFTDGRKRPIGGRARIEGGRNVPTLLGVDRLRGLFWDGGAASLEEQALKPITSPIELDRDLTTLLDDLNRIPAYAEAAQRWFGTPVTKEVLAVSLARYQRTLHRRSTPYDRFLAGDASALAGLALEGYRLFAGKAGCVRCHFGPDLTDGDYHNLGVPADGPLQDDWGRFGITGDLADLHKFKTPTLKGISQTAPYMHNGVFETLEQVLKFKNRGCGQDHNLSSLCRPLGLTSEELAALLEFLKVL